jgi:hypothetical protein
MLLSPQIKHPLFVKKEPAQSIEKQILYFNEQEILKVKK